MPHLLIVAPLDEPGFVVSNGYVRVHRHSPVEVMDLRDASALVRLILAVARRY